MQARPAPVHPVRVAMLPLLDARDSKDEKEFRYQGVDYRATVLEDLRGEPIDRVTEAVARHLAKARVFAQMILVLKPEQAPEADLFLSGKVRRIRGYVESEPTAERPRVLSEVLLTDVALVDRGGRRILSIDAGWSIFERRPNAEEGPTPWTVLSETLAVAVGQIHDVLVEADLSLDARAEVSLDLGATQTDRAFGDLGAPYGWTFTVTSTASVPVGWKGRAECEEGRFAQRQAHRFHRALGPYRPTVTLHACPNGAALSYDHRAEFPARYLGDRGNKRYFMAALGQTNWPNAAAEITEHLSLNPPSARHVFELKAVTSSSAASR